MFHCMVVNGILFMCATESDFGKRLPYTFLAEVCSITYCGDITQHVISHVDVVVQYCMLCYLNFVFVAVLGAKGIFYQQPDISCATCS